MSMAQLQQTAQTPLVEWNTGLLDCFEDASTCCYGFWCFSCLACTVSGRFGENTCLPLCDILGPAMFAPPASISLRVSMRSRYGIKGSICKDIAIGCFCRCCSWCQMHRELKERKKVPTVIILQPQNVVNSHPSPMMINNVIQSPVNYASQPGVNYASQPGVNYASQPGVNYASQPGVNYASQPGVNYASQPGVNYASQPEVNNASQPGVNHASQPGVNNASQPGVNNASQPIIISEKEV